MRTFLRAHWKVIVAIVLLILLALATVDPGAAMPEPSLSERLRSHASAVASEAGKTATPARLERAARYIERTLRAEGYRPQRQACQAAGRKVGPIEASVANLAPGAKPARIFIVGANDPGSGTAAVLELARLLKDLRPSLGTEVKFVFFLNREAPRLTGEDAAGDFIAYVGTAESSRRVQDALSAFRAAPGFPERGLAAPAYVQGVTLSGHSFMITDTAFMRYPYYHTLEDTLDTVDYDSTARVVQGLARTMAALAAGQRG